MSITILGGSAAGGNSGAGCAGYVVKSNQTTIVLDFGPGTLLELRRHADFRGLAGIVVSHLHADHVLDLVALRYALAYNPIAPKGLIPLWMPPGGISFLESVADAFADAGEERAFFPSTFNVAEYDPGSTLTIGDITIRFARTVHYRPCWAMRLSRQDAPGSDLLYTADTGPAANLEGFGGGCRIVLSEATLVKDSGELLETRGHLTATEAGTLAACVGAETLILTHLWEENGFDGQRERASLTFAGNIEIARPGLAIDW
jgi:ribonuclease BN (tRNA processing enzyme)